MKNIDLTKDTVKILGVYCSYNSYKKKLVNEKNFKSHFTKNRDGFDSLEDKKFNPWMENLNLQDIGSF